MCVNVFVKVKAIQKVVDVLILFTIFHFSFFYGRTVLLIFLFAILTQKVTLHRLKNGSWLNIIKYDKF